MIETFASRSTSAPGLQAKRDLLASLLREKLGATDSRLGLGGGDSAERGILRSMADRIEAQARSKAGQTMLWDGQESWTGEQLLQRIQESEAAYRRAGIDENSRVEIRINTGGANVASFVAVARLGALPCFCSAESIEPHDTHRPADPNVQFEWKEGTMVHRMTGGELRRVIWALGGALPVASPTRLMVESSALDAFVFLALLWSLGSGAEIGFMPEPKRARSRESALAFSVLFFSSNQEDHGAAKYDLLLRAAQFADQHGFEAVWVPERHFHPVGGLFPNPSVVAAALAALTKRIRLRAGSVVLPLHHPIRVAEDWAVVDNLSGGRVDLSVARGWNPNDFVLSPDTYSQDNRLMLDRLETIRSLWRGNSIAWPNALGESASVRIYPLPVQRELTCWMTCMGNADRFREAARHRANILTMLYNQTLDDLAEKVRVYREVYPEGRITLMLHAFVQQDLETVRKAVRQPFMDFIKSTISLHQHGAKVNGIEKSEEEKDRIAQFAYERYFRTGALFGTPESCGELVEKIRAAGVDELACQVDFGVAPEAVLESLPFLSELKDRSAVAPGQNADYRELLEQQQATHFLCRAETSRQLGQSLPGIRVICGPDVSGAASAFTTSLRE
jgi:natural product biosynthesis luciferase-like monooxygenase protein